MSLACEIRECHAAGDVYVTVRGDRRLVCRRCVQAHDLAAHVDRALGARPGTNPTPEPIVMQTTTTTVESGPLGYRVTRTRWVRLRASAVELRDAPGCRLAVYSTETQTATPCSKSVRARGLCSAHYSWALGKDLLGALGAPLEPTTAAGKRRAERRSATLGRAKRITALEGELAETRRQLDAALAAGDASPGDLATAQAEARQHREAATRWHGLLAATAAELGASEGDVLAVPVLARQRAADAARWEELVWATVAAAGEDAQDVNGLPLAVAELAHRAARAEGAVDDDLVDLLGVAAVQRLASLARERREAAARRVELDELRALRDRARTLFAFTEKAVSAAAK